MAANWLEGLGGKGMLMEFVLKLYLHMFVFDFLH